ncbi:MAG: DNA adenine methylase, partial [Candidatus Omnitrophica bacterium]|nr:DNA adenine methylase [Candidatus Omnitrophota bacterium]
KKSVAPIVWDLLGDSSNFVEPFAGSLAVLLSCPNVAKYETINDADCLVVNFWRALSFLPEIVADVAAYPVSEADLHARHHWLIEQKMSLREKILADPFYSDPLVAAWWVYGQSIWVGDGWCAKESNKRPRANRGGIFNLKLRDQLPSHFRSLAERLKHVRILCGDFERVLTPAMTTQLGLTGVFLDPPYSLRADRKEDLYCEDNLEVGHRAFEWAVKSGDDPNMRIVMCGYEGEYEFPDNWGIYPWKANGGMGNQGNGRGRRNAERERLWFSPHCLPLSDKTPGLIRPNYAGLMREHEK